MRGKTKKRGLPVAVVTTALVAVVALAIPAAASAKKQKLYSATLNLNAPIPDRASPVSPFGTLGENFTVGKKFKGKKVGDLSVRFQTSGSAPNAADDLQFFLVAPSGRTIELKPDFGSFGGQSMGPLTLSSNSPVGLCNSPTPPCTGSPFRSLNRPFVGTAGESRLALFNGLSMRKTWTFLAFDTSTGKKSTLNSVSLFIRPAA